MKVSRAKGRKARIEMIPLIDVTFLLLVFFIYISMSMTLSKGIPLTLPEAESQAPSRKQHISISVDDKGRIYWDREPVSTTRLKLLLQKRLEGSPSVAVHIMGDKEAPYNRIILVLDTVRTAGVTNVTLETRQRGKP